MFNTVKFENEMTMSNFVDQLLKFAMNWQAGKVIPDWVNTETYYPDSWVIHNKVVYFGLDASGVLLTSIGPKVPDEVGSETYWKSLSDLLLMVGTSGVLKGKSGTVPFPNVGDQVKFLCGNGKWEIPEQIMHVNGLLGMSYIGDVRFMMRPPNMLPYGWYPMFGEGYPKVSPQGIQLLWLKSQPWWIALESNWIAAGDLHMKITEDLTNIYLPQWANTNGKMPYMRAVNGTTNKVGVVVADAVQEITGSIDNMYLTFYARVDHVTTGSFSISGTKNVGSDSTPRTDIPTKISFAASRSARTSDETRVLQRGMIPALCLNT